MVDVVFVVVVRGARLLTTDSGSDASPIGWLKSWLAPQVTPAVTAIPNSAAVVHTAVARFTLVTLAASWLSDRKAFPAPIESS